MPRWVRRVNGDVEVHGDGEHDKEWRMVEERIMRGSREEPRAGEVEGYVHLDVPVRMRTMSRGSAFCVACEYLVIT